MRDLLKLGLILRRFQSDILCLGRRPPTLLMSQDLEDFNDAGIFELSGVEGVG